MRLDRLPMRDPESGERIAVVETPKGSRHKYGFDARLGALRLNHVLPAGMVFPFDFGFLPLTKAGDGDPLDVLILGDEATAPCCVVAIRLVGVIEAEQRRHGRDWTRNDRLIAVAVASLAHGTSRGIDEIAARTLDEIEAFFTQYNRLRDVEFRAIRRSGAARAEEIADEAETA